MRPDAGAVCGALVLRGPVRPRALQAVRVVGRALYADKIADAAVWRDRDLRRGGWQRKTEFLPYPRSGWKVPSANASTPHAPAHGILPKSAQLIILLRMAMTLNISLSQDQAARVKSRRQEVGFSSASDVIRDLIRRERDKELARLEAEFEKMDKRDGAYGPAPVDEIVSRVKKIRAGLLKPDETRRSP